MYDILTYIYIFGFHQICVLFSYASTLKSSPFTNVHYITKDLFTCYRAIICLCTCAEFFKIIPHNNQVKFICGFDRINIV